MEVKYKDDFWVDFITVLEYEWKQRGMSFILILKFVMQSAPSVNDQDWINKINDLKDSVVCQYDGRKYKKFYCIAKYFMYVMYNVNLIHFLRVEIQECCFFSAVKTLISLDSKRHHTFYFRSRCMLMKTFFSHPICRLCCQLWHNAKLLLHESQLLRTWS